MKNLTQQEFSNLARDNGMSGDEVELININQLKKMARQMKKATDKRHLWCLNEVAKKHGFKEWSLLIKKHKDICYIKSVLEKENE